MDFPTPTTSQNKRKRSENFNNTEEKLLIESVKKYKHIVECKKTDALSNKEKNRVWEKIAKDFNCNTQFYRTAEALKNKYLNMKKRCKKNFAQEKKYKMGTGGGPYISPDVSSVDMELTEILGTQVTGGSSLFDTDANYEDEEVLDPYDINTNIEWYDEDSNGNIVERSFEEAAISSRMPSNLNENENRLSSGLNTKKSSFQLNLSSRHEKETQSGHKNGYFEEAATPSRMPSNLNENENRLASDLNTENSSFQSNLSRRQEKETQSGHKKGLKWRTGKNFTSSVLKQPVSKALKPNSTENEAGQRKKSQPDPLKIKLSKWAESKSQLVDMQKQHCLEEHEKRMAHLDKKNQLELEYMKAEHEARLAKILKS